MIVMAFDSDAAGGRAALRGDELDVPVRLDLDLRGAFAAVAGHAIAVHDLGFGRLRSHLLRFLRPEFPLGAV